MMVLVSCCKEPPGPLKQTFLDLQDHQNHLQDHQKHPQEHQNHLQDHQNPPNKQPPHWGPPYVYGSDGPGGASGGPGGDSRGPEGQIKFALGALGAPCKDLDKDFDGGCHLCCQ